jgi:hypothetical protein
VRAALSTIFTASESAKEILLQTPTNFSSYCPNVDVNQSELILGVDLPNLAKLISDDFFVLDFYVSDNVTSVEQVLNIIEDSVDIIEFSFGQTEKIIWLVPGLLLGVSISAAMATFGVILAWKHESGLRFQRFMSYGVLPVLSALCIVCWILGIGTTLSTAMSSGMSHVYRCCCCCHVCKSHLNVTFYLLRFLPLRGAIREP